MSAVRRTFYINISVARVNQNSKRRMRHRN